MRHFLEELAEWNHGFGGFERLEVSGVLVGWVGSWIGGTWHFDAFWISCSQEIHRAGLSVRGRQVTAWDQWRMPGATGQAAFATRAVGRDGCFTTWLGGNLGKLKRCFYFCLRCENGKGNFTLMDANSYVVFMTNSDKSVSKLTHLLVAFPLNSSSKCTRSSACRSCSISEPQNKTHSHHSHKTWIQYNPMNKKNRKNMNQPLGGPNFCDLQPLQISGQLRWEQLWGFEASETGPKIWVGLGESLGKTGKRKVYNSWL